MLYSTQRMGIRFCLNEKGELIDSKESKDLTALCRVCGEPVKREEDFQLFQHIDKQCEHLVLSEVCERLISLLSGDLQLPIPIDYSCTNSISVELSHCSLLVDTDTRPLIELTLLDNQTIYLTIALEDSEVDQKQIHQLRTRFESVIEVNLSNLAVPSTDFTTYLKENVLNSQFHKRCSWLSFNPLHPLTRNIASLEHSSIESEQQSALIQLEQINEKINLANGTLERIKADTEMAQHNLTRYQNEKRKYDLHRNIEDLKQTENSLLTEISKLRRKKSELYNGTATSRLNQKVEELRDTYATGLLHIAKQSKEKEQLATDVSRLKKQIETSKQDINSAKWLKRVLERFDCTFGDLEQELTQIVQLSESIEDYENRSNRARNALSALESKIEKKHKELQDTLDGIEYYKKEKFQLFRDNKALKDLVVNGDV
ncbi:hypothetical protein [Vibrio harveyi]|uniref:hypothetical protein n=1 Tax=Vibrio harveyi TaxID=669 RepID=UPI00237D67A3|nr:hypothetical protein [Vibrio harveyi]